MLQSWAIAADNVVHVFAIIVDLGTLLLVEDCFLGLLFFDTASLSSFKHFILIVVLILFVSILLWLICVVYLVDGLFWWQLPTHLLEDLSVLRSPLEHFEARQRCVVGISFLPLLGRLILFDA